MLKISCFLQRLFSTLCTNNSQCYCAFFLVSAFCKDNTSLFIVVIALIINRNEEIVCHHLIRRSAFLEFKVPCIYNLTFLNALVESKKHYFLLWIEGSKAIDYLLILICYHSVSIPNKVIQGNAFPGPVICSCGKRTGVGLSTANMGSSQDWYAKIK